MHIVFIIGIILIITSGLYELYYNKEDINLGYIITYFGIGILITYILILIEWYTGYS